MTFKLTIQRKLLAFSFCGAAFVALVGAIGYASVRGIAAASDRGLNAGLALKAQMEADMAHDALRGDVLSAYMAGLKQDSAAQAGIRADLAEHTKALREALQALESLPLNQAAQGALAKVRRLQGA
jgi:hypothetical protein